MNKNGHRPHWRSGLLQLLNCRALGEENGAHANGRLKQNKNKADRGRDSSLSARSLAYGDFSGQAAHLERQE